MQNFSKLKLIVFQSMILTKANLKARYRNSVAGYLWVIISPLSIFLAQAYVFKVIFKFNVNSYLLFLLLGVLPWIFFSQTTEMATTSLYHNSKALKSLPIHPFSFIAAQVFDNLINNITAMILILLCISGFENVNWTTIWLFPLPYFSLAIFTVGLSFILAIAQILFFDVKFILNFVLGLLFFISPIVYPETFVPTEAKFLIQWNPLRYILKPFRDLIDAQISGQFWLNLGTSFLISIAITFIAYFYWRKKKNEIYLRFS